MKITGEAMMKALNRKRFAWVDQVMREELPTDIYGGMHSANLADRKASTGWLKEHGYRVNDAGDGTIQVFRGTRLVRQTRLILELDDPEELLSVMEAVKDNSNIPLPPWHPK